MGAHAYAYSNVLTGLAAGSFTWSNTTTTNRAYVNDGRMDKRQVVDASAASGINVIIDLGAALTLVGFGILNSNAAVQKDDAAVLVEASSASDFGSDVNTAKAATTLYSATSPRNKDHVLQFVGLSKRYWRLTWTWTGNVTDFAIGELFAYTAGGLEQLTRRSVYGSGETREAIVAQSQMQYGETRGLFLAGPVRQLDLQWDDLNASERDELYTMHVASNFGATPFLWVESYEASALAAAVAEQECIYGRLTAPRFQWSQKDFGIYQPGGFSIRSLGREAGA